MISTELIVEGEPAHLIIDALQALMANAHEADGMVQWEGQVGGDSGAALLHALGRITAELHAADIRSFLPGGTRSKRTDDQRRADALVLLVERLHEATSHRAR